MKKLFPLFLGVAAFAALMTGCNPVGEFRDLVDGGTEALMKEDAAYRALVVAAPNRGEDQVAALSNWVGTLNSLKTVMAQADSKLQGKKVDKIRASKDVQTALARFKAGIDEVLGRNYAQATLKLVAPWRLKEAQSLAEQAPNLLKGISSYYASVFNTANTFAGRDYTIAVQEDMQIVDTYDSCVSAVRSVTRGQSKNSYCVSAAQNACGHQIDVGCVERGVKSSLADNLCPDMKSMTLKINEGDEFDPSSYVGSGEELKEWKYGATSTEANPNRAVSTFCPGDYDAEAKAITSRSGYCGYGPKVRVYGYDGDRHVQIDLEGIRRENHPDRDATVDIYAEGAYIGTRVIRPDYGWTGDTYTMHITERAFQPGSLLKLSFRDWADVQILDPQTNQYHTKKAHWVLEVQIKGEDVPFIHKREVFLTKYTPNSWVGGVVSSCRASSPVLK